MSNTAIDQILQLAPPVRSAVEPIQPASSDRPAFQDHLARASSETLAPESSEPIETDRDELTSNDQQPGTASSQEEETSVAAEVDAADQGRDSEEETEQDTVELSDTVVILADVQVSTEHEEAVAPEQSDPENESQNTNTEENKHSGNRESAEKTAVLTETNGKPDPSQQQADKPDVNVDPAKDIKVQKVVDKTPERPAGELEADVRQKNQTATPTEPSTSEEQAPRQPSQTETQTEEQGFEPPGDQKSGNEESGQEKPTRQDSNPQPIAAKTESPPSGKILSLDEPSALAPNNQPSVSANAPAPDATTPLIHSGGEDLSASQRTAGTSAASADALAEAEPVPTVNRARFIQRVGGAIRSAQNRDGEIHLQLRPPELGSLRIEIVVKQGVLTAQLETETAAAKIILLDNLPALRERLAEQDIRIEKFDVNVRDEGGQQPDHPGTEDRKANRPQPETRNQHQTNDERQQTTPTLAALETSSTLNGSLDVRI